MEDTHDDFLSNKYLWVKHVSVVSLTQSYLRTGDTVYLRLHHAWFFDRFLGEKGAIACGCIIRLFIIVACLL